MSVTITQYCKSILPMIKLSITVWGGGGGGAAIATACIA